MTETPTLAQRLNHEMWAEIKDLFADVEAATLRLAQECESQAAQIAELTAARENLSAEARLFADKTAAQIEALRAAAANLLDEVGFGRIIFETPASERMRAAMAAKGEK